MNNLTKEQQTSTLTHQEGFGEISDSISPELIAKAKLNDADAQFKIAMLTLSQNKLGFAKIFFDLAARGGHLVAKKCLEVFKNFKGDLTLLPEAVIKFGLIGL